MKAADLNACRLWLAEDPARTVCLALGVVQICVITWPPAQLIIWPDSIGYLGPALDALQGGQFTHREGRGFVYPLFLLGVLSVVPEPLAIAYAQRLLVVFTYAALAYSVWLLTDFARRSSLAQPPRLAMFAAFWLLAYVAYPPALILAHAVLAETMFSAFLAVILLCVIMVSLPETSPKRRRHALALAVICSVALALVKPHWLVAVVLLPGLLFWLVPSGQRQATLGWILVPLLLAITAFVVPEKLLQDRYDAYTSKVFGPRSLFCNSADLIYADLKHQVRDSSTDQLRQLLGEVVSPTASGSKWRWLGFNGDKCMYGATSKWIAQKYAGDVSAETAYYWHAYLGAILRQPDYLFKRIGRQLFALAARPFNETNASYPGNAHIIAHLQEEYGAYRTWLSKYSADLSRPIESPFAMYQFELKVFYSFAGLMLLLSALLAVFRLIFKRDGSSRKKTLSRLFIVISILCFAINCLIAIIHTFDISRYVEMQVPMFVLFGMLASILSLRQPIATILLTECSKVP